MPSVAVPAAIEAGGKSEIKLVPLVRLLAALSAESVRRGDGGKFFASGRDMVKCSFAAALSTVQKRLKKLNRLGYLSRTSPGVSGPTATDEAATYLWHDPPIPGRAVWAERDTSQENHMRKIYEEAATMVANVEVPDAMGDVPELAAVARALLAIRAATEARDRRLDAECPAFAGIPVAEPGEPGAFAASFGAIARLAGLEGEDAIKTVKSRAGHLCQRGHLSLLRIGTRGEHGAPGQASEWLWHDDATPGLAKWGQRQEKRSRDAPIVLRIDDHREKREAIRDAFRPADDVDSVAVF